MSDLKHTPGPWRLSRVEVLQRIEGPDGLHIATLPFSDRKESNARLIAAAPDLLEAARGALRELCALGGGAKLLDDATADVIRELRAAISKAAPQR